MSILKNKTTVIKLFKLHLTGRLWGWVILSACFLPLFQSCSVSKYLQPNSDQLWLVANKIEFDKSAIDKVKGKNNLTEQLSQRYQQKPNRKLFGIPRPYFYFISLDSINKSKFGLKSDRAMRRILGEEPVYIDTSSAVRTAELMTTYLQNKGFFQAEVDYSISTNDKKTKGTVTYLIKSKGQYTIDTLIYESKDTAILEILHSISGKSFLKSDAPIDIDLYEKEVSRITNHLINNGYANFYPQYINSLEAIDSSNAALNAQLILEILVPPGKESHNVYYIGDISVYPDYNPHLENAPPSDTIISGIHFASGGKKFRVRPKSLTNSIALRKGELYRFEDVESTRRQIAALGVFTTPTIRIDEDPENPNVLNFKIQLTPNKKWEVELSGDISYTERNGPNFSSNLIGLTASPSFRNRNMFRGAELFVAGLDFGVEIDPLNTDSLVNSLDIRAQTDLYFPRFVEYPKVWSGLSKLTGNRKFYDKLKKNGISRVSASYNWLNLLKNYNLSFLNLSFGHDIKLSAAKRVLVNQAGIDLLIPKIDTSSAFSKLLDDQPFLKRSFSKQFMTGFLFRDITYVYDESFLGRNSYWYFTGYFDVSGIEMMSLNWLTNKITNDNDLWNIAGVDFSHYLKLELDGRRYWKLDQNRTLIARMNIGVVRPFYNSTDVPYVKQFYVGTPNSIRGWYARGLGPGSFIEDLSRDPRNRNRFYQAADFKIVMNLEYRQFIFRPFGLFNMHGALFLDGGNIWTLNYDPNRIGSQFSFKTEMVGDTLRRNNFLKAMAVAGGIGFRFDVSYFTFRSDFGTPLRNPYPDPNRNGSYWADFNGWGIRDIAWSLGLGYPF